MSSVNPTPPNFKLSGSSVKLKKSHIELIIGLCILVGAVIGGIILMKKPKPSNDPVPCDLSKFENAKTISGNTPDCVIGDCVDKFSVSSDKKSCTFTDSGKTCTPDGTPTGFIFNYNDEGVCTSGKTCDNSQEYFMTSDNKCIKDGTSCLSDDIQGISMFKNGKCTISSCHDPYLLLNDKCSKSGDTCTLSSGVKNAKYTYDDKLACKFAGCNPGYFVKGSGSSQSCETAGDKCYPSGTGVKNGVYALDQGDSCNISGCADGYTLTTDKKTCFKKGSSCTGEDKNATYTLEGQNVCTKQKCNSGYINDPSNKTKSVCIKVGGACTADKSANAKSALIDSKGNCIINECNDGLYLDKNDNVCKKRPEWCKSNKASCKWSARHYDTTAGCNRRSPGPYKDVLGKSIDCCYYQAPLKCKYHTS